MSQALVKPPQKLQPPNVTPAQEVPSVIREQTRDSFLLTAEQLPPMQRGVITLRFSVPAVSQVLVNEPHVSQAPKVRLPQDVPDTQAAASMSVALSGISLSKGALSKGALSKGVVTSGAVWMSRPASSGALSESDVFAPQATKTKSGAQ